MKFQRPCPHLSRRLSPSSPLQAFRKTTNPWSQARLRGGMNGRNRSLIGCLTEGAHPSFKALSCLLTIHPDFTLLSRSGN
jgi:hypothetical protein